MMQLPMVEPLKECLRSKSIFLEETMFISNIEKNFFITFKEINEITVYKNLSLFDIIQMQRLFTFMFLLFWEYIEDNGLKGTDLFWRSILPVFELGAFKDFLAQFFSQKKVNSFFELFAWSPEKNKFFDLQTYPFIMLNEWVILPLGILSNSNLCRNILQATGFRFDSESSQDPIVFAMERCLKEVSSIFRSNLKYSFQGIDGEIDVLAVIDDYIFIFECKNSLHPCSPFELRTTYDYIKKAAKQLSDFQKLWQEELFRDYIAHKIKSQKLPSKLSLCIVTGNRMFPGWREEGYSVRSVHELLNFINSGEFRIHSYDSSAIDENRKTTIFKLWKQTNFNSKDLFKYIEEDFIHKYYFESMIKRETKIQFKDKILTKESYGLDMNKLLKQFIDNFKIVEES
ncbi:MAG: hypothetical protein GVY04_13805 [Cyanobacteria bacterium]|nr:hypothetical protein [Cyanobacteria bacterium GSL.Bin1]